MSDFSITINGGKEIIARLSGAGNFSGRAVIGTNLNYAEYVSKGTGPHTITAAPGRALFWKGAAHPVRSVRHPGTKANPYVENALVGVGAAIVSVLEARIVQIIEGGGGNIKGALLAGALLGQAEVQRGAPVKTGTLRRSWHTEVM